MTRSYFMIPHGRAAVLVSIFACALAGCAAQQSDRDRPDPNFEPLGEPDCFYGRQVSSFTPLDRQNLIVYAPGRNNAYHVRISPPSIDLRSAFQLGFESRRSRICGYAGDKLIIERGRFNDYSVTGVYRLEAEQRDYLLEAFGRRRGEDVEAEPAEGAEIERDIEPDSGAGPDKENESEQELE